ncbi:MAG: hypothetical protein IJP62_10930 [Treponema sp.]|nr:hypothetical protein [Treponema sp.]
MTFFRKKSGSDGSPAVGGIAAKPQAGNERERRADVAAARSDAPPSSA